MLFIISLLFVGGADSLGLWTKSFDEVKVIFVYNILKISDVYTHIYTYFIYMLEKAMAPHSSTLAWQIPWMEEPGRLQSMGSLRVRND